MTAKIEVTFLMDTQRISSMPIKFLLKLQMPLKKEKDEDGNDIEVDAEELKKLMLPKL